ncbi:uncharacterized protein LOC144443111 [Glandiceps talaboti]
MPNARILSPNDPRIKDSEKYKQWKADKEKKLVAEKKREKERKEAEEKHKEEVAEQRKEDFDHYSMIRDFELLVEHLVRKAVDISEKRYKERQERDRKEMVEEVMTNWNQKKQEEDKKEKKAQHKNKMVKDFLEQSQLLHELKENHQKVMDDGWNFQKWFDHELELREHNLMRYMEDEQGERSKRQPRKDRQTASAMTSRTADGFYTSWSDDRRLIRKLKKTVAVGTQDIDHEKGHCQNDPFSD